MQVWSNVACQKAACLPEHNIQLWFYYAEEEEEEEKQGGEGKESKWAGHLEWKGGRKRGWRRLEEEEASVEEDIRPEGRRGGGERRIQSLYWSKSTKKQCKSPSFKMK